VASWAACSSRWLIACESTGSAIASPPSRADRWQTEARAALRDDVADLHRALTEGVLATTGVAAAPSARVDDWVAGHADGVARYRSVLSEIEAGGVFDLATLGAARRELRELCEICGAIATE
jgi:glutamate dehydrogenase